VLAGAAVAQPALGEAGASRERSGIEARADTDVTRLEAVEVRADRSLEERFASPTPRVTVGRADIEQMGADTIADVLQRLPGVQVTGAGRGAVDAPVLSSRRSRWRREGDASIHRKLIRRWVASSSPRGAEGQRPRVDNAPDP